jgi:hypothetical protein
MKSRIYSPNSNKSREIILMYFWKTPTEIFMKLMLLRIKELILVLEFSVEGLLSDKILKQIKLTLAK